MILRVFLDGDPDRDRGRAVAWLRMDDAGRTLERGRSGPNHWPEVARIEGVLAANAARLVALDLPPMPPARLRAAAAYAIEDQLATPIDEAVVATGAQGDDGRVLVAVASGESVATLAAGMPRIARLLPESALAPVLDGWTWCASAAGGSFVRRSDGSTLALGDVPASGDLPAELASALAQAQRSDQTPARVHVAFAQDIAALAKWSRASGIEFVAAQPFRWDEASPDAYARAPNLLAEDKAAPAATAAGATLRAFRLPLAIAALALGVHIVALLAQWTWLSIDHWRSSRALVDLAAQAGVSGAATPAQAAAGIARRHAGLLHGASRDAPADALPLLARAAPLL
ncbi:MAG TPA: type II secretion system protein GspL, partial [Casimicrobiaceae bacterium]|nr:type II secretion system protein GspL [Casimicrobiaceae bacterium]